MRTARAYRRTYAVLVGLLWLLGIEVLPNLHLADHASGKAHEHTADGMVVIVTFDREVEPHRHDDGTVHSHEANARKDRTRTKQGVLAFDRAPDGHVAAGLAHRAVALHEPPPPTIDAVPTDRVVTELVAIATGRGTITFVATADARGPPSA